MTSKFQQGRYSIESKLMHVLGPRQSTEVVGSGIERKKHLKMKTRRLLHVCMGGFYTPLAILRSNANK